MNEKGRKRVEAEVLEDLIEDLNEKLYKKTPTLF